MVPGPWWLGHVARREIDKLLELGFDPNAVDEDEGCSPFEYFIRDKDFRNVDTMLEMGARVTPELLACGKMMCYHSEAERLDYEGDCCLILEMLQHAHDLPPRLCATVWSFAQMSGVWRDLIQPVVQERMSKEEF
jgi:hypothetical protein